MGQPPAAGGFGASMQSAFGSGMQSMGMGPGQGTPGRPTVRNPVMTMAIPYAAIILGPIVFGIIAGILNVGIVSLIGSLVALAGMGVMILSLIKMGKELREVNGTFKIWKAVILPFLFVPDEMAKAKQMRGVQVPARSLVVYFFLAPWAFATDLNDIANAPPR
jgi:hypothetical protein